jgi:non-ribosomal peptide synthetase component E (peptide arylation enzyme)
MAYTCRKICPKQARLPADDHVGADAPLGSCGQPSVDAEIQLIDKYGADAAPGEPGEVVVRAPFTMAGYLNVIRRPGTAVTAAELTAHVRARLAGYKVPKRVEFVDAIPRRGPSAVRDVPCDAAHMAS